MSVDLVIRPYEEKDHQAVRELFITINRELAPAAMRQKFEEYIASSLEQEIDRIGDYYRYQDRCLFWVAAAQQELLGYFGLEPSGDHAFELRRMYVAPTARRLGIARRMLRHAEAECVALGSATMVLSTSELQPAALALYAASGYKLVREEVAVAASNKTVGSNVRRFYFEKTLRDAAAAT